MRLEYTKYQTREGIFYRPTIDILFGYKDRVFSYKQALVDTGSDFVMLPMSIAEILGAEPDLEAVTRLDCVCGNSFASYSSRYPIEIVIDQPGFRSISWLTHVKLVDADATVLLGHRGFLDRFDITFSGKRHAMNLTKR